MPSPIRGSTLHHREHLSTGWDFCAVAPDAVASPDDLNQGLNWLEATVPCTAASALRNLGRWSFDAPARRFDAEDWWFRCEFVSKPAQGRIVLGFDGLATLAEVWLNSEKILSSENMFIAHEVDITDRIKPTNSLYLRFRSLDKALTAKRPRPRWKAPMIENQQLRWFRTTVLGRTPGWSPSAAAVGPWRPVWIESRNGVAIEELKLRTSVDGAAGKVHLDLRPSSINDAKLIGAELIVTKDDQRFSRPLALDASTAQCELTIPNVERWWPHTHGEPTLYSAQLLLRFADASSHTLDLGHIGFRTVRIDTTDGQFRVLVNEIPIFCRGACWTPIDAISLAASAEQYEHAIKQFRDAGMNMLRIAGTTIYENHALLDQCDRQGVLIWQEFMFASMDFPEDDAPFLALVETEVNQQLALLQAHAAVAVLCGNSEVEQQAAMFGTTRDRWSPRLFHTYIPELVLQQAPELAYWPSSAHGGAFPHQPCFGTSSYYGVGAYLRSVDDARRSEVRFATECLAFANPAAGTSADRFTAQPLLSYDLESVVTHINSERHATGAFEFVRDYYLSQLFKEDPRRLWQIDRKQYAYLTEIASAEVMGLTFNEWRRIDSSCAGALVWFWRDLAPGNGWGILDVHGVPKASYYYLRRALQPMCVFFTDEGCNEPAIHVVNETAHNLVGRLAVSAHRKGDSVALSAERALSVNARSAVCVSMSSIFDWFVDFGYAFQFADASYDILSAEVKDASGAKLADAIFFPTGPARPADPELSLEAKLHRSADALTLSVVANRFAQAVRVEVPGFIPEDNYFHLLPGRQRHIRLRRGKSLQGSRGTITALNARRTFDIAEAMAQG